MPEIKKLNLNDPETKSENVAAENVGVLGSLFPEAFKEGKIDFEILKQLLGSEVEERDEKYGLNWHGKRKARQIALTPSTGTLLPCPKESVDWDKTQNLMIEGDNLEVLKLLQKSYFGKIKFIYIDPPYNTGRDFVYSDDFHDSIKNYLAITGQTDQEGIATTSNAESSGRFHTDWLNMLLPRLRLARTLLSEDGVIAVSIDDHEQANLRKLLDEIFGEENFVCQVTVESDARTRLYDAIATTHEYIVIYARSDAYSFNVLSDESKEFRYEDEAGGFDIYELRNRNVTFNKDNRPNLYYPFWVNPSNADKNGFHKISLDEVAGWAKTFPQESQGVKTVWRWGKEKARKALNTELFAKRHSDGFFQIMKKYRGTVFALNSVWTDNEIKTDRGTLETKALFNNRKVFDHPKPAALIERLMSVFAEADSICMDFFAGSGTMGQAVINANTADSGKRKFILVQLPQQLDPDNKDEKTAALFCDEIKRPRNLCELTKERLRRAQQAAKSDLSKLGIDAGFRVFKLASSNIHAWEPEPADLKGTLLANAEHLVPGRTEQDVLYELLLKLGLDLCVPIEKKEIAGKAVHSIGGGTLIVCLADGLTKDTVEKLANGIVAWRKELAPAIDTRVVFKDSGFADDVAKTNMAAILNQNDILDVRSL